MWPFGDGEDFLENQWYVAAWGNEVSSDKPFERLLVIPPVKLHYSPSY